MIVRKNQILDISELSLLTKEFCKDLKIGDLVMLTGELGSGKTTFSRFVIKNLYFLEKLKQPTIISSPTYPILLTYNLKSYEVYHYDLYRIKNIKELEELDFFANIKNSITLIEWPELLLESALIQKYYLVNLDLHSEKKRNINIKYFE